MVSLIRQFFEPHLYRPKPSLRGQLAFRLFVCALSGLLWWAVSGHLWVAGFTLAAQAGGPALVALAGRITRRPHWSEADHGFDPRQVVLWAYYTGATTAAFAMVWPQLSAMR